MVCDAGSHGACVAHLVWGRPRTWELIRWRASFSVDQITLMVVNSFRLSRIVYLSLKEKGSTIVLSLALLVVLIMAVASKSSGLFPGQSNLFLWTYSPGLNLFALQCIVFGIMYSITACLSLLFHLPTTSEFQHESR